MAIGTQFSDLPSCLVIEILVRLPVKALLICRYVRKDWTRLYFSDPYFIRRQLQTSNIQFLSRELTKERNFRFGWFVDEVSTGNLRVETLELSCKFLPDPEHEWCVVNSCNGLVCLVDEKRGPHSRTDGSSVYVCNPILGEWVSITVPNREGFYGSSCALGFCVKNNQYKVLLCIEIGEDNSNQKYEWEIYTLGTGHWRSIETKGNTKPWHHGGLDFNTSIHGSLHWAYNNGKKGAIQSFDFETERFMEVYSQSEREPGYVHVPENRTLYSDVSLGVMNGCLWLSFASGTAHGIQNDCGIMVAMKEYGVDKPWTRMLVFKDNSLLEPEEVLLARKKELVVYEDKICDHNLLFTLNGDEMLTCHGRDGEVICYNIKTTRRRNLPDTYIGCVMAYNPSFVSLHEIGKAEQVTRGVDAYGGYEQTQGESKKLKKSGDCKEKGEVDAPINE